MPHFLERLIDAERVAEVDGAREHLLGAVEAVCRAQLLGTQDAERFEQLGADLVLPAVAARGGREDHAQALSLTLLRQQRVVLVVGVRGDVHHRSGGSELAEDQLQSDQSPLVGDRAGGGNGTSEGESETEGENKGGAESTGHRLTLPHSLPGPD